MCDGSTLPIGGFQKHSLVDFPGRISAVIFTKGCNFRCIYCHNPQLVYPELFGDTEVYEEGIFNYLKKHRAMLDALVITGGEPTMHPGLPDFIRRVYALGLEIKLDTNGTNPDMLQQLLKKKWVHFIAMDIKTVPELSSYRRIAGKCVGVDQLQSVHRSIEILNKAEIPVEFRTTVLKHFHNPDIIGDIRKQLRRPFTLQNFKNAPGIRARDLYPVPDIEKLNKAKY
jgi:pyruvate formate lyase activating enzyme